MWQLRRCKHHPEAAAVSKPVLRHGLVRPVQCLTSQLIRLERNYRCISNVVSYYSSLSGSAAALISSGWTAKGQWPEHMVGGSTASAGTI
jgi:hypothetical protein